MGNQTSKTSPPAGGSASPSTNDQNVGPRRALKRRDSSRVSPLAKTTAVAPTASLESATGESASSSRASGSRSRGRASTTTTSSQKSQDNNKEMGSQPSAERTPRIQATSTQNRSVSPARSQAQAPPPIKTDFLNSTSIVSPRESDTPSPTPTPYYLPPPSQFIRPPRLPLPIEDDLLSPGSPILSPADIPDAVDRNDMEGTLPRKSSVLSSTTMDEDEMGDEIFRPLDGGPGALHAVNTLIEWKQGGTKVYVTGTFANFWNKKFKLHENGPSKDPKALSAIIPLLPGTHHVAFLVDGQMQTASHMPTAVDWTNALVNYIEVGPAEPSKAQAGNNGQSGGATKSDADNRRSVTGGQPIIPPTPELRPTHGTHAQPSPATSNIPSRSLSKKQPPPPTATPAPLKKPSTEKQYFSEIPKYLHDLDAPEESSRYARASAVMGTQPAPPSLPMFLNKSILNGATPMKDDSSVLVMPNHTVLNHLATSSIKNGVLATSATTRYKKKYVTTILYKPTSETAE